MPTYKAIATTTVGAGGASSITFSSIPQTYTDLVVLASLRTDKSSGSTSAFFDLTFNGLSSDRNAIYLEGNGTSTSSYTDTKIYGAIDADTNTVSTFGNSYIYILNYTSSNNKPVSIDSVWEQNGANGAQHLVAGLWSNTAAITSITLTPLTGYGSNFKQYSTATLYGIKNS